eukprot:c23581_g1_i1.p2 GENE.c23581_g1_i1~~c23581_g1_i1.p2  ORF type:complete len:162 (+),score=37.99 c23581_g1_i1:28-486(+)
MADDDVFDSILHVEQTSFENGRELGVVQTTKEKEKEGFDFGVVQAGQLSYEMGYYLGCCSVLRAVHQKSPFPQRMEQAILKLEGLCRQFHELEADDPELSACVDNIRAKFKQLKSLLGLPQQAWAAPSLFANQTSAEPNSSAQRQHPSLPSF